jgi:hydrogenase maturation protease
MSLHQTGFQEVLSVARLRGWDPEGLALVGCQPEVLEDYGGSLSETVRRRLPQALGLALETLAGWRVWPRRRLDPPGPGEGITLDSLGLGPYEGERPSAKLACRFGDGRFVGARPCA